LDRNVLYAIAISSLLLLCTVIQADPIIQSHRGAEEIVALLKDNFIVKWSYPRYLLYYIREARVRTTTDADGDPLFLVTTYQQPLFEVKRDALPQGEFRVRLNSECGAKKLGAPTETIADLYSTYIYDKLRKKFISLFLAKTKRELSALTRPLILSPIDLYEMKACPSIAKVRSSVFPIEFLEVYQGNTPRLEVEDFTEDTITLRSDESWFPTKFVVHPKEKTANFYVVEHQNMAILECSSKASTQRFYHWKKSHSRWKPLRRQGNTFYVDGVHAKVPYFPRYTTRELDAVRGTYLRSQCKTTVGLMKFRVRIKKGKTFKTVKTFVMYRPNSGKTYRSRLQNLYSIISAI